MTSLKMANRRVGSLFAVAALVLATVTPGLVPAFASAAQVTERSVELSSSSKVATGVAYEVNFKSVGAAGAIVLDFCQNSPLIGSECTQPGGFNVSTATVSGGDFVKGTGVANDDNTVFMTGTVAANTEIVTTLSGITNPTAAGPLYVRIVTFANGTAAGAYTSEALGTSVDSGSAAVSITDTVGVSAAVLESLVFCVSGAVIVDPSCANAAATAPVVALGEPVAGDVVAINAQDISEGSIFSQISTNAASGAVVSLKSSTTCGGLKRAVATVCDIAAAGSEGLTAGGQAKFGVRVTQAPNPTSGTSDGAYQIYGTTQLNAWYDATLLKLNYVANAGTGITSPYGDPLLDTNGAPVNNKNVEITFGASAANNTPAGTYATDLSLIATGKF